MISPATRTRPGGQQGLARHPALRVLGQEGVEDRVGDLVGHLVGMAFGHRFRCEGVSGAHGWFHSDRGRPPGTTGERSGSRTAVDGGPHPHDGARVIGADNSAHTLSKMASATASLVRRGTVVTDPSAPKMVTALVSWSNPDPRGRHVVGHHQVDPLGHQLGRGPLGHLVGLGGEAHQHLTRAPAPAQLGEDVRRRLEDQLGDAVGLVELGRRRPAWDGSRPPPRP